MQWVGLVYADAIAELAAHDDSFPWRKVAEGILISAMQMQKLDGAECGHVGFYPDAWSTLKGSEAYHWCLAPTLIGQVLNTLYGVDPRASATVVRHADGVIPIVALGNVTDATFKGGTLRFTSHHLQRMTHDVVVARVAKAEAVLVDGKGVWSAVARDRSGVRRQDAAVERQSGDVSPHSKGMLRIRVEHTEPDVRVEIRGLVPLRGAASADLTTLPTAASRTGSPTGPPPRPTASTS